MEKKDYEVKGTVTISTEEYRDLIVSAIEQEKEADSYRSQYWCEHNKVSELEKQLKLSKEKYEFVLAFINDNAERVSEYKAWVAQKREDEDIF